MKSKYGLSISDENLVFELTRVISEYALDFKDLVQKKSKISH